MPINDSDAVTSPAAAGPDNKQPHKYAFVTLPGSEEKFVDFKFLVLPYNNPGIQISADRMRARRTAVPGKKIVYFNHKIDIGMGFAMKTLAMSGPRQKYSYMFGATTCTKTTIQGNECHVQELCTESVCGGKHVTSELWNCSKPGDFIAIVRGLEQFKIEVSNGKSRKEYLKWIPNSRIETLDWYPFIILDAEVDAVEFIPGWRPNGYSPAAALVRDPRPINAGIREMADNLVSTLGSSDDSFPGLPSSAAGDRPHAKKQAVAATLTPVPAVQVEHNFLQTRYLLENMVIKLEGKQAERNSKTGARLVYLSEPFTEGTMFSLQVVRDNAFLHQKEHTFVFGLTSCDKKSISKYESHAKEPCADSDTCAGHSCLHPVSSSAHAGSTVSFQREADAVDIKISSSKVGGIQKLRIPANMIGIPLVPFFQLSGNADAIRLSGTGTPAAALAEAPMSRNDSRPQSQNENPSPEANTEAVLWKKMQSLTTNSEVTGTNGDDGRVVDIRFLTLSYEDNAVRLLNGNRKVRRTAGSTSVPVYFDREIEVGMSVVLDAENAIGFASGIRFEFGFTSCDLASIRELACHTRNICTRSGCSGESHTVGMRYNSNIVSGVTVTRMPEYFAFDVGTGVNHKRFLKHPPEGKRGPNHHWIPFIRLNGDVDAVTIADVTFKSRNYDDYGVTRSPFQTRFRNNRSASPALSVSSVRSGYRPQNGRRSSEAQITPVRVVNSRPTTKAFAQIDAHNSSADVSAYRNPQTIGMATGPISRPVVEKKAAYSAPKAQEQTHIPSVVVKENKSAVTVTRRKWFNNAVVHFNDPHIIRVDESADAKSYIFSAKMQLNEKIGFRVIPVPGQRAKLVFGVTTKPLLTIDTGELPVDAAELHSCDGWFVYEHLATCVSICDGLAVMRSDSGISLMLPHDPDSGHEIISGIDASAVVCPFFQFSGCKLEILYDV
jgi:hypothetical protein